MASPGMYIIRSGLGAKSGPPWLQQNPWHTGGYEVIPLSPLGRFSWPGLKFRNFVILRLWFPHQAHSPWLCIQEPTKHCLGRVIDLHGPATGEGGTIGICVSHMEDFKNWRLLHAVGFAMGKNRSSSSGKAIGTCRILSGLVHYLAFTGVWNYAGYPRVPGC